MPRKVVSSASPSTLLVGSGIAAKHHRCERVETPVWAVATSEAILSLLRR
ncbi:MAG: hypothetical protein ABIQ18_04860 [Umezawaea sp.]